MKNPIVVPHTQSQRKPYGKKTFSKKPYEMIRQKVAGGKVAGADETGVNVSGRNNWLWAFQNGVATYLAFDSSRGHGVITDNFTPKELEGKVWVTDRWPAYFMGDVGMEDHQICHLLRNLTYTMQAFPDDDWSLDMLDLLRDSVHHRNQGDIGPDLRTMMEKRLDELLARPPVYAKTDGSSNEQRQREDPPSREDQAQGYEVLLSDFFVGDIFSVSISNLGRDRQGR